MDHLADLESAAPFYPPETCPRIDSAVNLVDAIMADLALVRDGLAASRCKSVHHMVDDISDARSNLATVIERLEDLRAANDQLRNSGRYWRLAARQLAADAVAK